MVVRRGGGVDTLRLGDGRTLSYADFGEPKLTPVIWCHGGPGSRFEPYLYNTVEEAKSAGFRLICIDRPGYGGSTPLPGRTIGGWATDALALADHLALKDFFAVGHSTGAAYALGLAACSSSVRGVIACAGLTDLRLAGAKAMSLPALNAVWDAPNRDAAIDAAKEHFGEDGRKLYANIPREFYPFSDLAMLRELPNDPEAVFAGYAQGVLGLVDDRIADGCGWTSFDVSAIRCPVTVLHGADDPACPLPMARHTAAIVPAAKLSVHEGLGHASIVRRMISELTELRSIDV
jgi:pimeloyl-ACP methyl ester carboxylesterase